MAVFIDANVFLYAAGTASAFYQPCVDLLGLIADDRLEAVTSTEVVQEVLHVASRHRGVASAVDLAVAVLTLFPVILPVQKQDLETACNLLRTTAGLGVRDSIHLAVMLRNGLAVIISADQDFDRVDLIKRIDPTNSTAIRQLLCA